MRHCAGAVTDEWPAIVQKKELLTKDIAFVPTCSASLQKLAAQGTTILMVEQNVKMADDAIALESGQLVLHKKASELLADPNIERLFLGGGHVPGAAAVSPPSVVL